MDKPRMTIFSGLAAGSGQWLRHAVVELEWLELGRDSCRHRTVFDGPRFSAWRTWMLAPVSWRIHLLMLARQYLFQLCRALRIGVFGQACVERGLSRWPGHGLGVRLEDVRDFPAIPRHQDLAIRFQKQFDSLP